MKKTIGIGVGALAAILAGFAVVVAIQPAELHVERSATYAATPADVGVWLTDLKKVDAWSPWNELDPEMTHTYSETTDQVGSWTAWDGNDEVGAGRQTITSIADGLVTQDLHFDRPFESDAVVRLAWAPKDDQIEVTWSMTSQNGFMGKAAGLFMDMDTMLGDDFEKGLALLQPLVAQTVAEREAAEAAQALAAAEVAEEVADPTAPATP